MRVAIQTLGSRGDVQPYLALALALHRRGHRVQLAAPAQFEAMAARHDIAFVPLPAGFLALLDTPEGKAAVAGGGGFGAGLRLLRQVRPLMRPLLEAEWAAVRGFRPDIILHHPKSVGAPHMARALGCPSILASPLPGFTPTAAFPSPVLSLASLGPFNRASHALAARAAGLLFAREIRAWRAAWPALAAPRPGAGGPRGTLYAYSPQVVPVPADWGSEVMVSGYWFLDSGDWVPPPALAAFLAAGEAPVYVGFGSMPGLEPRRLLAAVVEALARLGRRGVLATGGGALAGEPVPGHVCLIDEGPHDWLFPRVAATVHHGGAGTTAASLRAGRPAVICPFFGDQPFWGRRVAALGAGPRPLDRARLTAEGLAAAIRATDEPGMRARAAALGRQIRAEDGLAAAARFIEAAVAGRCA